MPNMLILLYRDELWVTREHKRVRIEEMEPSHARNTAAMLRRSPYIVAWRLIYYTAIAKSTDWDSIPEDVVDEMAEKEFLMSDVEWLNGCPLLKALDSRATAYG